MSRSITPKLIDSAGRSISIKDKPLARGGEGAIYEVINDVSLVAKVYNAAQPGDRSEKLRAMAELATPELQKVAAWPTGTLHEKVGGPVTGILMPRIAGYKEIHHLYSVAQRKRDFPEADWRFLTYAALNSAIAFEQIHRHGHVVGDVNQKNVMVSNRACVQFVDCDSFQVRARNSTIYRCNVGVPEYTPPELQGKPLRDLDRLPDHDAFGLAVLIFHLLMMGRHPFAGVYLDHGDMPIEKAIHEGRFAYSPESRITRMQPPPNTLPVSILDENLLGLFGRAFRQAGPSPAMRRPTATEWKVALASLLQKLVSCKVDSKHIFPRHAGTCPWCLLLGRSGVFFFNPGTTYATGPGKFDLLLIWGQVEQIPRPNGSYARPGPSHFLSGAPTPLPIQIPRPTPRPKPHPLPGAPKGADTFLNKVAGIGTLIGFVLLFVAPPVGMGCLVGFGTWLVGLVATRKWRSRIHLESHRIEERRIRDLNQQLEQIWDDENPEFSQEYKKRRKRLERLESQLKDQESEIIQINKEARTAFEAILSRLHSNRQAYEKAKEAYSKDLTDLTKRSAQIQLERHLDGHLIRSAKLKAMTTQRILSLSSFGIETALEVQKLRHVKVPGIGDVLTARLNEWRDSLTSSFKPQAGIPSAERAAVDQRHAARLRQLERVLADGPRQLRGIVSENDTRRKNALAQIQVSVDGWVRAKNELEVVDRLMV